MNEGFSWNGKTLLSGINPAGKAARAAEAVPAKDRTLYLCPSPLFGYGLERLLERIEPFPHAAVLCIEAEPELFALAEGHFGAALAGHPRLRLTGIREAAPLCALLRRQWGPRFFRRLETVRLNGGWQLHRALYDSLAESLRREIALDWGNAITLAKLGRRYIRNALRNLALIPRCPQLGGLSFGGDPVLVLGAGPSLDQTLDGLQARFGAALSSPSRPFRIVCVDTCLASLRERGIAPDLAVILESQLWNLGDFIGLDGWKVPAAFDLSALPRSAEVLCGGLYLFFTPWTALNIFDRLAAAGLLPCRMEPLGSVGLSAVAIARRLTQGAIVAAGLDFSFTLDSFHARSTPGHKGRLQRQNRFTSPLNAGAAFGEAAFAAVSKNGGKVMSSPALRHYRDLFEREFAALPDGSETGGLFDISGSGLPLGIETLSPESAFDLLQNAGREPPQAAAAAGENGDARARAETLSAFALGELGRLTLLRDMLAGLAPMDSGRLAALIDECDYLWAHFPDYAASDRRPGKAELEAGGDAVISFLKRLRAEIDPFAKLWEMAMGERGNN